MSADNTCEFMTEMLSNNFGNIRKTIVRRWYAMRAQHHRMLCQIE